MNSYILGEPVKAACTFAVSGVNTDPTTVQAKIRQPNGTITVYNYGTDAQLVRDGQGIYHVIITTTSGGVWSYRFIGTGACATANEAEFFVDTSDFGATG